MEFETKHLIIKKFIPEYIPLMYETWGTDREVGKYMPGFRADWDLDGFRDYIMTTFNNEYYTRLVIQDKKNNAIIGHISLYQEDSRSKSITIWLMREHWNKGYGREALKEIVKKLAKTGLGSLYATCDSRNIGAVKILEAAGFECIDTIPDYRTDIDGHIGDELLYELEFK